jgi:hypothetical protein
MNAELGVRNAERGEEISLVIVSNPDDESEARQAILYVWRNGKHFSTATGRLETLRQFAARHYPDAQLNERILR